MRKIIYICGFPRSGSTLIGNILGSVEGFIHVGETYNLWEFNCINRDVMCSCSKTVLDCPFWSEVKVNLKQSLGVNTIDTSLMRHYYSDVFSDILLNKPGQSTFSSTFIRNLYNYVFEVGEVDTIIDSSKKLLYVLLLKELLPSTEVHVVHLVRDPRGVMLSRQHKQKVIENGVAKLRRAYMLKDVFTWNTTNLFIWACFKRGLGCTRINYEQFVTQPELCLQKVLTSVGEGDRKLPFISDDKVRIESNHVVRGNRSKFKHGVVQIRKDTRWRRQLSRMDEKSIRYLSLPAMKMVIRGSRCESQNDSHG